MKSVKIKAILIYLLPLIIIIGLSCKRNITTKQESKLFTISGKVMETSNYCGGVEPPCEEIRQLAIPRPLSNKKMYLRKSRVNKISEPVIKEFITDNEGNFTISLPQGTYCIIEEIKKDTLKIPDFTIVNKNLPDYSKFKIESKQCFEQWWSECDTILNIPDNNITDFVIRYHRECKQPCIEGGPLPQ